jgi:uncharacterized protein HemX
MAHTPNEPNDTSRSNFRDDPLDARFEREAQVDPELSEGRASHAKVTLVALGIAIVLGVVFYGLNNSSVHEASMAPPAQTAQTAQTHPANPNNQPGTTTGAATSRPAPPQASPKATQSNPSPNPGQTK